MEKRVPQKRENQPRRIQPPILGPLKCNDFEKNDKHCRDRIFLPRSLLFNSEKPRIRLGCPSRSTFSQAPRKLDFVDGLAEKSTVIGPPGGGV